MKVQLMGVLLLVPVLFFAVRSVDPPDKAGRLFMGAVPAPAHREPVPYAISAYTMFARGIYPGNNETFDRLRSSGFTTVILSSFYIRANGDVYSGDDSKNPVIHNGSWAGNSDWLRRVASLKQQPSSVTRIEILLEGRWINQPPNTYDFIRDWTDTARQVAATTSGPAPDSTLYRIAQVMKEKIGVDAVCIDDESVYDSRSIVRFGTMVSSLNMHMTLCPYTNFTYWRSILSGSKEGLVDAIYVQCYDGGRRNTPGRWKDSLATGIPVYPVFLCRGSFDTCSTSHNSKTPDQIKADMARFKTAYPGMSGGGIWQMADVDSYVRKNCAVQYPESGSATSVSQYLTQLKASLQEGL